jgi:hypothetical protein
MDDYVLHMILGQLTALFFEIPPYQPVIQSLVHWAGNVATDDRVEMASLVHHVGIFLYVTAIR